MASRPSMRVSNCLIIAGLLTISVVPAAPQQIVRAHLGKSLHHAVSKPLRDLPIQTIEANNDSEPSVQPIHRLRIRRALGPLRPDPVLQTSVGPLLSAGLMLNFEGVDHGQSMCPSPCIPPDTNGAIGATQYVQWVNESYEVFDKSTGARIVGPIAGKALWKGLHDGCETTNRGDPIVQYDKLASRWVMTQFAFVSPASGPFLQCIAISQTPDATGKWDLYSYLMVNPNDGNTSILNDYPKLGVWPDAYYMTFDMFPNVAPVPAGSVNTNGTVVSWVSGSQFSTAWVGAEIIINSVSYAIQSVSSSTALTLTSTAGTQSNVAFAVGRIGPQICAFDRNAMLNGLPSATSQCVQLTNAQEESIVLPGDLDGTRLPPAGSRNYLLAQGMLAQNANTLDFLSFHVDWTTPRNSFSTLPQVVSVASFTPLCPIDAQGHLTPCVPQKSEVNLLDSLADRLMYRLAYRNFADHQSLVVSHSVSALPQNGPLPGGVRWYELRNPNGSTPPTVFQQGTHAPDSTTRWMSSIGMDKVGDIGVGYSVSDAGSTYPSVRITGRVPTDPPGQMQTETGIVAGSGAQTGAGFADPSRWGDYSAMAVDPVDDCTFWYTQEYYQTTSAGGWNTRIGNFSFPNCTSTMDFSLSLTPPLQDIAAGTQATYTATVTPLSSFTGTVTLSKSNLPPGATATFTPSSITGGSGSSTLTVTTSSTTTPNGPYTITATGTSGSIVHSAQSALSVNLPHIISLSPTLGPEGTLVTITGKNFATAQGSSTVRFNGTTATTITSWSATQIKAKVPVGATTGMVQVTVNGQGSNLVLFTVTPHITSLSPVQGVIGTSVTITGTTFGATKGTSTVKFNGTPASPTSWASTQIIAPVPPGAATGNVVVTVAGHASNGVLFTVSTAVPQVVQQGRIDNFGGTEFFPNTITFGSVNVGNFLFAVASVGNGSPPEIISDTRGNIWTPILSSFSGGIGGVWYCIANAASVNGTTVTFSNGSNNSNSSFLLVEVSFLSGFTSANASGNSGTASVTLGNFTWTVPLGGSGPWNIVLCGFSAPGAYIGFFANPAGAISAPNPNPPTGWTTSFSSQINSYEFLQ
jgi:hypothetical protein